MFSYAFARGYAERHGLELHTDPWIGQKIFEINDPPIPQSNFHLKLDENNFCGDDRDFLYRSYSQNQRCADYYSVSQIKSWFTFRPEIKTFLSVTRKYQVLAHQRKGDYSDNSGFPIISEQSFHNAADELGIYLQEIVTEEHPMRLAGFDGDLKFLPDFYRLMTADVLFRGNSTFSWWAAALSEGKIYSPLIKGLKGGIEHDDVKFVEGNWPACADLSFVTDIHLKP